jgi:hypothetical protein
MEQLIHHKEDSRREGYTIERLHQFGVEAQVAKSLCFLVFSVVVCSS